MSGRMMCLNNSYVTGFAENWLRSAAAAVRGLISEKWDAGELNSHFVCSVPSCPVLGRSTSSRHWTRQKQITWFSPRHLIFHWSVRGTAAPESLSDWVKFFRRVTAFSQVTPFFQTLDWHSSGAVWEWRWPNEPSGFRGRKAILNHASALVSAACP